ncbi:MAG: hypothetical protein M5U28_07475 [Sandaracinaceae bacterium]|nr:hypothetical protein [Sandaracinaceae bacterium]
MSRSGRASLRASCAVAAAVLALALLAAPGGAIACTCRRAVMGTMDYWCRQSAIIAVVEVESVAPAEWPDTFYMWTRVVSATAGADLLADRMRFTVGGFTSCDLDPWPVGTRARIFLRRPNLRHLSMCEVRVESVADDEVHDDPCSEESLAVARSEEAARERAHLERMRPRGACASCTIGARRGSDGSPWLALMVLAACVARRRSRPTGATRGVLARAQPRSQRDRCRAREEAVRGSRHGVRALFARAPCPVPAAKG